MKKHLLLVSTLAISMLSAQNNEGLKESLRDKTKRTALSLILMLPKNMEALQNLLTFRKKSKKKKLTLPDLLQVVNLIFTKTTIQDKFLMPMLMPLILQEESLV